MSSIKLKDIFGKNDENKLVLPDFQRDFVWDKDQQKNLLASFLTYLPVGSILLLDGTKDDFANKKMCFPKECCFPKDECTYLLDGQQRITSLKSIFTDLFCDINNWKGIWDSIFKNIRNRWFIRVIPKDGEEDIFGYKKLEFKGLKNYEPNQVVDYIEYRTIYKTRTQDWFNPGFIAKDKNNKVISDENLHVRNYYIAEYAAKEGLIPLFTLYKKETSKALHEYVVEKISRERVDILKAEIKGIYDIEEKNYKTKEYLTNIEPNIDIFIKAGDEDSINSAWSNLSAKWSRDIISYLEEILNEDVPTTELPAKEINRAVAIFESINKGGTPLDTFDLVVAKAAKDKTLESLSKRLLECLQQDIKISSAISSGLYEEVNQWHPKYVGLIEDNELTKFIKNQFLNMLSIFSNVKYKDVDNIKGEHIKKFQILSLSFGEINENTGNTMKSLIRACAFLQLRCGITNIKELPYELMILPIAYCLIDDSIWNDKKAADKIEYWYWSCLFGGAYRERQNEQCIKDIKALYKWINGEIQNPFESYSKKVLNEPGYSDENLLLMEDKTHDVQNAIRKGLLQYILSREPKDFIYDKIYLTAWKCGAEENCDFNGSSQTLKLQDHHICPLSNITKIGQSSKEIRANKNHILNSPLNRTYISSVSNSKISDMKPQEYFKYVSVVSQFGHCIPDDIEQYFRNYAAKKEEIYKEFLKYRYKEIYKTLVMEIDKLKS